MGKEELQIEIFSSRNLIGLKRYGVRIRDLTNKFILLSSTSQGYSRKIDARKCAEKIQRYACMAEIVEVDK